MGQVIDVTQYKETFTVPKEAFRSLIINNELELHEMRVLCYLLTDIPGFNTGRRISNNREFTDPLNFRRIDPEVIAEELGYSEKKVKKAIKRLRELYIIEKGDGPSIKGGFRFTF